MLALAKATSSTDSTDLKRYCKPLMSLGRHGRILLLLSSTSSIDRFIMKLSCVTIHNKYSLNISSRLPWWSVVGNLPVSAGEKVQYLIQEDFTGHTANRPVHNDFLNLCAAPTEKPTCPRACAPHRSHHHERLCTTRKQPGSLQREKALTQQRRPNTAKYK